MWCRQICHIVIEIVLQQILIFSSVSLLSGCGCVILIFCLSYFEMAFYHKFNFNNTHTMIFLTNWSVERHLISFLINYRSYCFFKLFYMFYTFMNEWIYNVDFTNYTCGKKAVSIFPTSTPHHSQQKSLYFVFQISDKRDESKDSQIISKWESKPDHPGKSQHGVSVMHHCDC